MSVFRSAALRLPIAPRATLQAVRFNSALANPSLQNYALNDSKIPAGTKAFQIDVPDQLPETDFLKRRKAVEDHAQATTDLWRKISFYVCIPGIIVAAIYVWKLEEEHEAHLQHVIDENGGVPPERKVYSYMNMRTKPFPWGNQSLFYNERYNISVDQGAE